MAGGRDRVGGRPVGAPGAVSVVTPGMGARCGRLRTRAIPGAHFPMDRDPEAFAVTPHPHPAAPPAPFDLSDPVFVLHEGGKLEVRSTAPLRDRDDLSLAYTPGVAEVCMAIAEQPDLAAGYTWSSRLVAVVT